MIYLQLFWSFFQVGAFSIGGGYAAMPLIQSQVVDLHSWLTLGEFADVVTIAEMTPGPIAINSATFVGIRVAGLPGALVATAGCVVPSCVIVLTLAYLFYKYQNLAWIQGILNGLRPAVVAMIASAGLSILFLALVGATPFAADWSKFDWLSAGVFVVCLIVLRKWKPNPIAVMAGAGVVGAIVHFVS